MAVVSLLLFSLVSLRELTPGSDAEYMILRTEATVRVPKDVDPAAFAPLLCAGVTTFNSMRNMNIMPGSVVAVQGLGGLGHLAIQFAAKMGLRVVALSSSPGKEDFARELGATDYVDGSKQNPVEVLNSMGGASLIVTTAPNPKAIEPLVWGLKTNGTLLLLARKLSAVVILVDCYSTFIADAAQPSGLSPSTPLP